MDSETAEQRKLAAIMFTDMVGYSLRARPDSRSSYWKSRRLLREIFPRFHGAKSKPSGTRFWLSSGARFKPHNAPSKSAHLAKRNHDVTSDRRIERRLGFILATSLREATFTVTEYPSRIEALAGAGGLRRWMWSGRSVMRWRRDLKNSARRI
jgi:hypothetical protein